MKNYLVLVILCVLLRSCITLGRGEQCGLQAGGSVCPDGRCCSPYGWCGSTKEYCGDGCQSQCSPSGESEISDILPRETFYKMLPHLSSSDSCPGGEFYTYDSFVEGASNFTGFGTTGDLDTRKREIAAFLAHTSFETANVDFRRLGDPYSWGYCYVSDPCAEKGDLDYCDTNDDEYPCAPGERYYGRGPFQLKGNHNYGAYQKYSGLDLLNEPDLLLIDPSISFEAAFWYWMVPQTKNKLPSSHDVMVGGWIPTQDDIVSGRLPGFGLTTNVIVGEHECGKRWNRNESDRIGFYKRYCEILGVDPGDNLSCDFQRPFSTNNPNNNHVQTM